jgi:hypothetical protein
MLPLIRVVIVRAVSKETDDPAVIPEEVDNGLVPVAPEVDNGPAPVVDNGLVPVAPEVDNGPVPEVDNGPVPVEMECVRIRLHLSGNHLNRRNQKLQKNQKNQRFLKISLS